MRIVDSSQMKKIDRRAVEVLGISSLELMENAGKAVVAQIEEGFNGLEPQRVGVLCGRGHNGGDGFVIARQLALMGKFVDVVLCGRVKELNGDVLSCLQALAKEGVSVAETSSVVEWDAWKPTLSRCDLLVDALVGTGLRAGLEGTMAKIVHDVNLSRLPVVSVDLPSGVVNPDHLSGSPCIRASLTVTFVVPKMVLISPMGIEHCGEVVVSDIGIPETLIQEEANSDVELLTRQEIRSLVPRRSRASHKGDFGHVVIVGGSLGKCGASRLAGLGAMRAGAGLVTVAGPKSCISSISTVPEYMTVPLNETERGSIDDDAWIDIERVPATVLAVGPGLGTGPGAKRFVGDVLTGTTLPLVLDADALNIVAGSPELFEQRSDGPIVVTPHPGEMARLMRTTVEEVQRNRVEIARTYASEMNVYVVLKGAGTLVASPSGEVSVNLTGNPGMACGGMGDVLTGMIAAWLAQLRDPAEAAKLAVYSHGLAGDLAAKQVGEISLNASDLIDRIGRSLVTIEKS